MNQRTHAWIAIRAVALLEKEGCNKSLVKLLKPTLKAAAIGAWIPDKRDAKIGGADTDNHVLKMKPYKGVQKKRFTLTKPQLLKKLGTARAMHKFLKQDTVLNNAWWERPYKADPQPGQHIADRVGALVTTITDLLIMGDVELAGLVPGRYQFAEKLAANCLTRSEQAAMYLYMQSHFIADACMPCHCDARKLASYSNGLHKELEAHWSKKVGTYFNDKRLDASQDTPDTILEKAKEIDTVFDIDFKGPVPELTCRDVWLETVYICRGSFAVASIISPPRNYKYGSDTLSPFETVFPQDSDLLASIDKVLIHDSVLNVAIIWKHIWSRLH